MHCSAHSIPPHTTSRMSRRRVTPASASNFRRARPQSYGGGWIGTGVETSTVRRVYDQFLAQQTRSSGTNLARLDAFASQAARIDNLLGDATNGLSTSLQSFTDAINEVSTHAGIDSGAPGADRRRTRAGRTPARVTTRACATCRPRSNGRLGIEAQEITTLAQGVAGSTAKSPSPSSRAASRPTTCSTSAMRSSTSCRARSALPSSPKAIRHSTYSSAMASRWCSAPRPRRSPRPSIRSIRSALLLSMRTRRGHRRPVARRVRRNARRPARLAQPDARSGAQ